MVFALSPDGKPAAQPTIRQAIAAGATAWTPSADQCLPAGRYAWTVRSGDDEAGGRPAVFRVAEDSAVRIRKLEEVIARLTAASVAQASPSTSPADIEPSLASAAPAPLPTASASDLRWLAGAVFSPPACGAPDVFTDVSSSNLACPWIEQLFTDGITQGCGGGRYCPKNPVTREQLAVLLGKVHHADAGGDLTGSYPGPTIKSAFRLPQACSSGQYASWNGSSWTCSTPSGAGDITAVNAGYAMTGGGTNGDVTIGATVPFHIQANGGHWGEIAGPGIGGTGDTGVVGWGNTGMFGYGNGTGVWGETGVANGVGVRGNAWAGGVGVVGYSGGSNSGVYGESIGGRGVFGYASATSGANYGVWGETASSLGVGIFGRSNTSTGLTNGFVGPTGVWGDSGSGVGVFGTSLSNVAVAAYSAGPLSIRGQSTANGGTAIRGEASASTGPNVGVHGKALSGLGSVGVHGEGYFAGIQGEGQFYGGFFTSPSTGAYFSGQGNYGIIVFGGSGNCSGCSSTGGLTRATIAELRAAGRLPEKAIIATNAGAFLSGGGTWVNSSDARLKENFEPIDHSGLLASVARLPIRSWNYIADGPEVRHIGPTAQDFQAAFGLGGGDTTISTIDPAGIALAAIQELTKRTIELTKKVGDLENDNRALRRRLFAGGGAN